jgi:hypothetical protein
VESVSDAERVQKVLEQMEEVEEDIKVLQKNLNKAKEYLTNTNVEDIDEEYFDEQLDLEEGLKHIVLF